MTSRDFCYWLQGFFELSSTQQQANMLTLEQIGTIKRHLNMVFIHEIDPSAGPPEHQAALDAAHSGIFPNRPPGARC